MLRYIKQYNSFVPSGPQLVQKVDYDIHWIHVNLCPVESTVIFPDTYSMDGGLSHEQSYPLFERPGPGLFNASSMGAVGID